MPRPLTIAVLGAVLSLSLTSAALAGNDDDDDDDGMSWTQSSRDGRDHQSGQERQSGRDRSSMDRRGDRDDRDHDRIGGMGGMRGGMHGGMGMMRMRGMGAAHFMLRSGDTRMAVVCSPNESMKACVDAATQLMDRAARVAPGSTTSGESGTSPGAGPGTRTQP